MYKLITRTLLISLCAIQSPSRLWVETMLACKYFTFAVPLLILSVRCILAQDEFARDSKKLFYDSSDLFTSLKRPSTYPVGAGYQHLFSSNTNRAKFERFNKGQGKGSFFQDSQDDSQYLSSLYDENVDPERLLQPSTKPLMVTVQPSNSIDMAEGSGFDHVQVVKRDFEREQGGELEARDQLTKLNLPQTDVIPDMILERRGGQAEMRIFGEEPTIEAEKGPLLVKNLSSTFVQNVPLSDNGFDPTSSEHEDGNVSVLLRSPSRSNAEFRYKQIQKEKLQKAGIHESWMEMVPDRDGTFNPPMYHGSGVPKMIQETKGTLEKQGVHKDWMDQPNVAKVISKRDITEDESNLFQKRRTGHDAAVAADVKANIGLIKEQSQKLGLGPHQKRYLEENENVLQRRRFNTFDPATCDLPLQKTGSSGGQMILMKGCRYHELGKRDIERSQNKMIKKRKRDLESTEPIFQRRAFTTFDASKCNMPMKKTGSSGNPIYLTTGCEYHGLGFGTSNKKRENVEKENNLQKRFVVLPPKETDQGFRFDVIRDNDIQEGMIFLKRSPEPYTGLVTAATSFATGFQQTRNNRKQTVVLNSSPDGTITGARTINPGGNKKLININFVRRPRQNYHQ